MYVFTELYKRNEMFIELYVQKKIGALSGKGHSDKTILNIMEGKLQNGHSFVTDNLI